MWKTCTSLPPKLRLYWWNKSICKATDHPETHNSISKRITNNTIYEHKCVHVLQISELWSKLANTSGTENWWGGNLCQHWGRNLPWSPVCQENWGKPPPKNKLRVNHYSQNCTVSWASARFKCKPHTAPAKVGIRLFEKQPQWCKLWLVDQFLHWDREMSF